MALKSTRVLFIMLLLIHGKFVRKKKNFEYIYSLILTFANSSLLTYERHVRSIKLCNRQGSIQMYSSLKQSKQEDKYSTTKFSFLSIEKS